MGRMPKDNLIPNAPFISWLKRQLELIEQDSSLASRQVLARRLGITDRTLYRWLRGIREVRKGKDRYERSNVVERALVEDALHHADVFMWEVYPELEGVPPLTDDVWCPACREKVQPIYHRCPWCETWIESAVVNQHHCGCGCKRLVPTRDKKNRPVRYVRGHAPRSLEKRKPPVPIAPFAAFVRRVVAENSGSERAAADVLGVSPMLIRETLTGRSRRGDQKRVVERKTVQRALRKYGAQGKGRPWKPGAPNFARMYGQLSCPVCGGRKSRAANRCRTCSKGRRRSRRTHTRQTQRVRMRSNVKMTAYTLGQAHRRHEDGESLRSIARDLLPRTEYASENAFLMALSNQFRRRGWAVRSQGEATAKSNVDRAFRPQCSHVIRGGKNKGKRCERRSVGDGGTCWRHDPERIQAGVARLRELDERQAAA